MSQIKFYQVTQAQYDALFCLPLLRSLTIERDAVATAGKSEKWIGNWIQKQDALNLQERIRLMGGYSDEQNIIL